MDVIAFSKANKVGRKARELDTKVLGKEAESRFMTVDARLDWIEQQSEVFLIESILSVDLSRKTFEDTQFSEQNGVTLKEMSPGNYPGSGVWESDVVDLGEGWQETISVTTNVTY